MILFQMICSAFFHKGIKEGLRYVWETIEK